MKEELNENREINEFDIEAIIDRKLTNMADEAFKLKHKEADHHPKIHRLEHRKPLKLELDFDEKIDTILSVFGDDSTADAVIRSLKESPIEIQIIAKLVIDLYKKLDEIIGD